MSENEKRRPCGDRVIEIERGTPSPLAFTTTGGMGKECNRYHSRLAGLISTMKGESYAKAISWIRAKETEKGISTSTREDRVSDETVFREARSVMSLNKKN